MPKNHGLLSYTTFKNKHKVEKRFIFKTRNKNLLVESIGSAIFDITLHNILLDMSQTRKKEAKINR